ncbi:retrovirus-related pol polyprotein from transposon TNT 1-94 [Tanacetum coccineum]
MFVLSQVVQIVLWYLDSGCSRHMTGDRARFRGMVGSLMYLSASRPDIVFAVVGYGDYKLVAFRQHSCHIRNYDMVDLLKGSRSTNLYSISLNDMMSASPVCLLTKASSTKSWLWHRRLNHLNFGTLNELARKNLVRGLPMLKYDKDHLGIFINQSKYAQEILKKFGFDSCTPIDTPMAERPNLDEDKGGKLIDPTRFRGMVGSLMYLSASRPDIVFAVVTQFLGHRLVSWSSKKQKSTAISTTEAEYIALSGCCAQILWMRSQLRDYGFAFLTKF